MKVRLKVLLRRSKRVRYLDHIETEGERLFAAAAELELEGIVAKRADSPYPAGRTRNWLKIKTEAGRENIRARARWSVRPMRGLTRSHTRVSVSSLTDSPVQHESAEGGSRSATI